MVKFNFIVKYYLRSVGITKLKASNDIHLILQIIISTIYIFYSESTFKDKSALLIWKKVTMFLLKRMIYDKQL